MTTTIPQPPAAARLDDADRAAIRRALELRNAIADGHETAYSGETEQRPANAFCVGAAGVLLGDLLRVIGRLDGAR